LTVNLQPESTVGSLSIKRPTVRKGRRGHTVAKGSGKSQTARISGLLQPAFHSGSAAAGPRIIFPRFPVTISRVMESIKAGSTLRINAGRGERGLLWQPRFFDRALRSVKEYYEEVEYIHLNPLGAGLVKRAEEWPWSSVRDYTGGLSATFRPNRTLAVDRVLLPADERGRI